jgi:signal transduction histidine kinase/DNA-binding NarL/FixJ family response regulator
VTTLAGNPQRPFRVLLVEDNPGDADLVRDALSGADLMEITHVANLAQARARLAGEGFDVVLLDLSLPDAIGLEGVETLHQVATDVPVVVLTGNDDYALGSRAVQAGAQDYLIKGTVDEWLLIRVLRFAAERHAIQVQRERKLAREMLAQEQAARAAAEAQESRMAFLAEVSAALSDALHDDRLDEVVAELAVPRFADCCIVERSPPRSSSAARLTVTHVSPGKVELVRALHLQGPSIHDGDLTQVAQDPARQAQVEALAVNDRVVVRLRGRARDEHLGSLAFLFTSESGRRYHTADRTMIHDIAGRLAVALENARLYRELRLAVAVREEFVAIASHELRTPLTALELQVDVLRSGLERLEDPRRERLQATCAKVVKLTARLEVLVEDLLEVSKSTADNLVLDLHQLDLRALVGSVADRFAEQASRAGCALEILPGAEVLGVWDGPRLERLVTNLVANAIKYAPGKPVQLALSIRGNQAELGVRDHGMGIAPADAARIFERFERAVSTRRYGGLGLGLHISREIARAHGGTIDVVSELGQGARFVVTLPLAPPAGEAVAA